MIEDKLRRRQWLALLITSVLLFAACVWSITTGEYQMSVGTFFKTLFGLGDYTDSLILLDFRLPRMLVTILAGAALSLSGAM
ncbi:iron ABC transporter permease, partial [Staphylococcus nepalensis]